MAGLGTLATTAIITKGLTCGHAPLDPCKTGIITSPFSLYCTGIVPPTPPSAGGGPYPYDAWNKFNPGEITNFYKPVPEDLYYIVPRDQEAKFLRRYKIVTLRVNLGHIFVEKEYSVPEKRAKVVVKALNVANKTIENITISINTVRRITTSAVVKIKNLKSLIKK